jgi:catechol 2,3-dioxygenase-like lactoylglutathione lyase family enzyme
MTGVVIGRLNHVAIAVPDIAGAAALYRDKLGAAVGAVRRGLLVGLHQLVQVDAFDDGECMP